MPKSLAILETGTFLLRAARISFFILATSAADLLSRLPLPLVVVVTCEPNNFLAISAKVLKTVRSFLVSCILWVSRWFTCVTRIRSLRTEIQITQYRESLPQGAGIRDGDGAPCKFRTMAESMLLLSASTRFSQAANVLIFGCSRGTRGTPVAWKVVAC